ncbi:aminotransferase class IV [uncultured Porphyromonas sp.]|uniref:aminotransferase class IV n=1 Tax=uncultured Porphyromonas sp. TaxID=159274 RepID=UPI002638BE92|nr:aminotransferase class IV [uncultured Porphyromonas sp.]
MGPLLETFCMEDGELLHLNYHQDRVRWSTGEEIDISLFADAIRADASYPTEDRGRWRVSVTYTGGTILAIRFIRYQVPEIKALKSIDIDANFYTKKWADRSALELYKKELPSGVEPLFILDGKVTDTSFTNILVEKEGELFTPRSYLLRGTKRSALLDKGIIQECDLPLEELSYYDSIHLINAMLSPSQLVLPIISVQ